MRERKDMVLDITVFLAATMVALEFFAERNYGPNLPQGRNRNYLEADFYT